MPLNLESKSALRIKFFELLFEAQEGYLCLASRLPELPKASFRQRFFRWPEDFRRAENYILSKEKSHDVYFCVNLLSRQERKKEHCLPTRLMWADVDDAPLSEVEAIPPSILLQSSPGRFQAFWRANVELPPYQAEDYSRRLAYSFGTDPSGWDLTQLFRVPFTYNFKYADKPSISIERAVETFVPLELFEALPVVDNGSEPLALENIPDDLPTLESVLYKYRGALEHTGFAAAYVTEPDDWSKHLWKLIHICLESGMSATEAFVVAQSAPCNKYARDGRPIEHLWREVLKADHYQKQIYIGMSDWTPLSMPVLTEEPATGTVLDVYRDWASEATDAIVAYHDLSCMILLSSITANSVRLNTSWGSLVPNLWGLILGDSTLARKSTAMGMMRDFINTLDTDMLMTTDGSAEGLLTGLSTRPNKVSIFYKDEVSGFFDSINRKDYLAGMPEILTHLYDVPPVYIRRLRKETIRIESPAFIFFGGGIRERVYEHINEGYIDSGFLPRFLVVSGQAELGNLRRTGPATEQGTEKRNKLLSFFSDLYELYSVDVAVSIGGQKAMMPQRIVAQLSSEAWDLYGDYEDLLTKEANESFIASLALPTFDRLARSLLKIAVILAASRQEPDDNVIKVEESDVINAAWYIQDWGQYSVDLISNAGKKPAEKLLEKIIHVIRREPGVLRSTIMQHYHLSKREADDILATLEDRQLVRKEKQGRGWRYYTS